MSDSPLKSSLRHNVLYIWDSKNPAPKGDWTSLLWSQHADKDDPSQVSIVDVVEEKSDELRARYLAWIHDLGEAEIDRKRIIDHLSVRPGFSYWWTTSLAQKFNCSGKSQINNAIKALALEAFYAEGAFESIVLNTDNITLAHVISSFCQKKNINFEFHKLKPAQKIGRFNPLFNSLPGSIVALIYLLRYVYRTLPLYFINRSNELKKIGDVMLFDVLVHLDKQAFKDGIFRSNYWTRLVDKFNEAGLKSNWVHLFFKHPAVSSLSEAHRLTDRFTFSSEAKEFHTLLERPLTVKMLFAVVSDFLKIRGAISQLKRIREIRSTSSDIDLWPFHESDWSKSLCGTETIDICIKLSCFSSLLSSIPKQRLGVYIAENQPWEMALIYAWKLHGHGRLIGAPHTTIRYWDLRYFHDVRSYRMKEINDMPMPDFLAINGPVAKEVMISGFYPLQKIVEVEALRYLYLDKSAKSKKRPDSRNKLRVLICGDFDRTTTLALLDWASYVNKVLPNEVLFVFKPHPAYQIKESGLFKMEISNESFSELLPSSDIVFTSNITSAAVDAFCSGVPVVQMLDATHFNNSPLRNYGGLYARNAKELADILSAGFNLRVKSSASYFNLDKNLSSWMNIILKK